jgi:ADP-dependent NAD(P)H-hydrate dehydratase
VRLIITIPHLKARAADANKGSCGRVTVIGGSRGMSGAAVLCGSGALRGGAGLVRVAVPHGILPIVATGNPCYLTAGLPEDDLGRLHLSSLPPLIELLRGQTVTVFGPGLGQNPELPDLLGEVLRADATPLVLDADGLNALAQRAELLNVRRRPLILTPHPGEFARLTGASIQEIQGSRQESAVRFAELYGVVLVLKGQGTIVTDGDRVYINQTGNPGMATGGTGDVLTGLIGALLGQGLEPFEAAQLGVYLHGLAGDRARDELGEPSLIASDLIDYLPQAFRQHGQDPTHLHASST